MAKKPVTLTPEMIEYMRADHLKGVPNGDLADNYGVSPRTVSRIVRNDTHYSAEYAVQIGQEVRVDDDDFFDDDDDETEETPAPVVVEKKPEPRPQPKPVTEPEIGDVQVDPATLLKPNQIIVTLSPMSMSLLKKAMERVGMKNIEKFAMQALVAVTKEYLRSPFKCPFSRLKRRTIRG